MVLVPKAAMVNRGEPRPVRLTPLSWMNKDDYDRT